VEENYLLAYILSKIASIASPDARMFSKEFIYGNPPRYCWRYAKNIDEGIYQEINCCVSNFQGRTKWIMYKEGKDGDIVRNHVIEPEFISEIIKNSGYGNMPEILASEYKEELQKAVEDVVPLA